MVVVSLLLFLLRMTGLTAHIIVSVLGLAVMISFAVKTKKEWAKPALVIAHKIGAALFAVLLLVMYVPSARSNLNDDKRPERLFLPLVLCRRIQHIFNKNPVAAGRIVYKDVRHRTNEFPVLYNR